MPAEPRVSVQRGLLEIAGVYLAILGFQWIPWKLLDWPAAVDILARLVLGAMLGGSLLASYLRVRDDRRRLGLAPRSYRAGLAPLVAFTATGVLALAGVGCWLGTIHWEQDRLVWAARYSVGLIGQQVLLQCFVANRLHDLAAQVAPGRRLEFTVIAATLLFATLHAPNIYLVGLTTIAGAYWVWHFRRHANLALVCASHLVLGTAAMLMLGEGPLLKLRVGYGAWRRMNAD